MKLTRWFDTSRRRGWLVGMAGAVLLLGFVATAEGDLPKDGSHRRPEGRGLRLATAPSQTIMNRNRLIFLLQDNAEIGSTGSSVAGGGFWIAVTNQYVFSSGPNIGATVPGVGDTVVAIGGPFSELDDGGPTFDAVGLDEFFDTALPEDFRSANDHDFPEVCTVDDFRVAQFPSLAPFAGAPFPGFADQTVCIAANDIQAGTCGDCGGTRVGVEIVETLFAFGVPSVQDFIFVAFRIFNSTQFVTAANTPAVQAGTLPAGPYDLENMIVAIAVDPDIGEAGDDQVAFLPDVQTMVFWDSDFSEPQFQGLPGFGGITYLKTPIDPSTGQEVGLQEFTVFTNGDPRPDPSSKEEWYRLMTGDVTTPVILEVDPRDVRGMASSGKFTLPQGQFVEIYAAYFFANVSGSPPQDLRAEGYKNLTTGELVPDANDDPAFDNFKTVQQTAQATFDAGFVVPTAPPKPTLTLIPGDGQVTLVFNDVPIESINPFAKVARDPFKRLADGSPDPAAEPTGEVLAADQVIFLPERDQGGLTGFLTAEAAGLTGAAVTNPAFDADFVIQDFQGFRVYRSFTGRTEKCSEVPNSDPFGVAGPGCAQLIAQFDLVDGIEEGLFCLAATAVFDEEGNFVSAVCTESSTLPIGTNSGLAFSIIDRGGPFGDPSGGTGLTNGIPVNYAVTSFAVNCGQTPVDLPSQEAFDVLVPPAACLVLETGLSPLQEATPRSNSSAFVDADVGFETLAIDGATCDQDQPAATVDATTGEYTRFLECSNAVQNVVLSPIRGTNIPSGDFFFVIDSILPSPDNPYDGGYALAFGLNRAWFHWEDESGNLATTITPTVGFINQTFDFNHASQFDLAFGLDTDASDIGADLAINFSVVSDFSAQEDFEINGQSLHFGELGGTHLGGSPCFGERRPHCIQGSPHADLIVAGNIRSLTNAREYAHPGVYAQAATSYELTWSVSGGVYSGTLRSKGIGQEIPRGGQPKGPDNPSTPGDFISGYNWGFIAPGTPDEVRLAVFPTAAPLTNEITLNLGDTFALMVPGQSVYIEGIRTLPADGDVWTLLVDSASDRGGAECGGFSVSGREPCTQTGPFSYVDTSGDGSPPPAFDGAIVNVFPGQRYKLSLSGGSNDLADANLSAVTVVPNPFVAANEITRGRGLQRILFTNLPPQATIRIYTISGNLIRVLEHGDNSGTEPWDVRTRFDLLVASGNYYYHVTTPDGRTHLGRFAVIN